MSLTLGSIAPLGRPTGGTLNIAVPAAPAHLLYLHDVDRRIRGEVEGVTVVDTLAARMLHETRLLPRWYFPPDGVRTDLLSPSATTSHCPFKGDAIYWDIRVGDRVVRDAFWEYPKEWPGSPDLVGLLSPYTEKFDRWLEEDEEIIGHPRDPFHRIDVRRSSAHVVVHARADVVADTHRAVALFETGLPTRWYVPSTDVRSELLRPTSTQTICPYKGVASYWTVAAGGLDVVDGAWSYHDPFGEALAIKGQVSFLGEGIEVEVDR